ncbi:putative Pentatricopeptide repeat-containing protein, variant 2 [Balamuthia mandrillaris]
MMSWRGGGCRPALWTFLVMGSKGGGAVGPVQQSSCLLARAPSTCARRIALHSWQVSRSVRQMHASSSLLFSSAEGTTRPASREAHDPSTRRRRRGKGVVLSRTEKKELYSTPRSHSSSNKGASLKQQEREEEEEEEEVAEDKEEHNKEDNKDDDETKELISLWQEYARHKEKWPLIFSYLQGLQTEMERAERRGPVEGEEDNKRPGKQRKRPLPPTFLVNLVLQQMVGRKNDLRAGVELVKLAKACGVPLSAATFSLLISAYGKAGQMGAIQRALQVMEEEGVPLNAFVYRLLSSFSFFLLLCLLPLFFFCPLSPFSFRFASYIDACQCLDISIRACKR